VVIHYPQERGEEEADRHRQFKADLEEIAKMLSGLISGLENRKT